MTDHGIDLDNGDSSVITGVVHLELQHELLSDKWSPSALVNVVSVNNTFENVRAGHDWLAISEFSHA